MEKSLNFIEKSWNLAEYKLYVFLQLYISKKKLKFTKLMTFMQHLQYNAPNLMDFFFKLSGGDTPRPPLVMVPRIINHSGPFFSKIVSACLKIA